MMTFWRKHAPGSENSHARALEQEQIWCMCTTERPVQLEHREWGGDKVVRRAGDRAHNVSLGKAFSEL